MACTVHPAPRPRRRRTPSGLPPDRNAQPGSGMTHRPARAVPPAGPTRPASPPMPLITLESQGLRREPPRLRCAPCLTSRSSSVRVVAFHPSAGTRRAPTRVHRAHPVGRPSWFAGQPKDWPVVVHQEVHPTGRRSKRTRMARVPGVSSRRTRPTTRSRPTLLSWPGAKFGPSRRSCPGPYWSADEVFAAAVIACWMADSSIGWELPWVRAAARRGQGLPGFGERLAARSAATVDHGEPELGLLGARPSPYGRWTRRRCAETRRL